MVEKKQRVVLPGDLLAGEEEFIAEKGTYVERGEILSALMGTVVDNDRKIAVIPKKETRKVAVGMEVYAVVNDLLDAMAFTEIIHVVGAERRLAIGDPFAILHVKDIKEGYVRSPKDEVRIGDFILAKVVDTKGTTMLSTKDSKYGVVKACCTRCRGFMNLKDGKLVCPGCGNIERRKVSRDYGRFML